jgi:hypothetical protein
MNDSQKQALLSYAQRIAALPMDKISKIRHYQESTTLPDTWDEIGVMIEESGWETLPLDNEATNRIDFDFDEEENA